MCLPRAINPHDLITEPLSSSKLPLYPISPSCNDYLPAGKLWGFGFVKLSRTNGRDNVSALGLVWHAWRRDDCFAHGVSPKYVGDFLSRFSWPLKIDLSGMTLLPGE